MKKILIFNGYFYPAQNYGGPITSIVNVIKALGDNYQFYVLCYNHDFNDKTPFNVLLNTWIRIGKAQVMYVCDGQLDFSISRMTALFAQLKPDLVWFNGILLPNNKIVGAIVARKLNIPILLSPRGEVDEVRVKLKAYKKIPYLYLMNLLNVYKGCYFHATCEDEYAGIVKYFHADEDHVFKVANISTGLKKEIHNHKKDKDMLKVFFFSRIHEVKNVLLAIEAVCQCKKKIKFDIYGPIESKEYWNKCLKFIAMAPSNVKINYRGIVKRENIDEMIQENDCFLFPTANENFGHVIAESLSNGRPVLISEGTTPWDDLNNNAGFAINLDKIQEFADKIDWLASLDDSEFKQIIIQTKKYFSENKMVASSISGHRKMFDYIMASK